MFVEPKKVVDQFGITAGMKIADLGAGAGFYAIELAKLAGENGRVYAVDIQQELLTRIKRHAHDQHLGNIEVIWGDLEAVGGTRLQENSIDFALVSNTFFQIARKEEFIKEVKRVLKVGAKFAVIEWSDSFGGLGPQPEDIISQKALTKMFVDAGFSEDRQVGAGDHHYGVIFKR